MRHALAGSPTAPSPLMRGPDQSVMLATILDVEREEKPSVAFSIFGTRHGRVDAYSVAIAITSDALSAEESLAGGGSSPPKTASVGHSSSVSASSSVPISQLRRERVWGSAMWLGARARQRRARAGAAHLCVAIWCRLVLTFAIIESSSPVWTPRAAEEKISNERRTPKAMSWTRRGIEMGGVWVRAKAN